MKNVFLFLACLVIFAPIENLYCDETQSSQNEQGNSKGELIETKNDRLDVNSSEVKSPNRFIELLNTVFQILIGALVAIFFTILIEYLRKPKIDIRISDPVDIHYNNRPAFQVRFLGVDVVNEPLPKLARWMQRNIALQCAGRISFYHLDGQNVFGKTMLGRWSSTPEPVPMMININNRNIPILNSTQRITRTDISPGESQKLDIAGRFDNDESCYGWSNDNYFSDPVWRSPEWKLQPKNRYIVKVTVITSSIKFEKLFRLINDVSQPTFRLEKALKEDFQKVK